MKPPDSRNAKKSVTFNYFPGKKMKDSYPNGNFFGELTNFGDLTILTNHLWCEFLVII
jgi:hypothetical protein